MTIKDFAALSDHDKALLFLYLCDRGLPPWGAGADQWRVLAALTGWDEARTRHALESCVAAGLAGKKLSYTIAADGMSIQCYRCGAVSQHPYDIKEKYCSRCHVFHEPGPPF